MVRITGADSVLGRLRGAAGREKIALVGRALFVGGDIIRTEAALSITRGSVSGRNHVPSLPGEPPNADTHLLDRSIEIEQVAPLRVQVSANAPYAVELEGGTSKMAARPFMGPAARAKRKEVVELVTKAVNVATRKGRK